MIDEHTLAKLWQEHKRQSSKSSSNIRSFFLKHFHKWRIPELLFNLFKSHLKVCDSDGSKVVVEHQLTKASVRALIVENSISAIHIPGFCAPETAEALSEQALQEYTHWKLGGTLDTDMFYAGGSVPIEAAGHNWSDFRRYFGEREQFVHKQRAMSGGNWPVDRLRLALDEAWPAGACSGQYLGQKLRPAIMRIMNEQDLNLSIPERGFIHTDDFPKLKPARGTYSANVYLKIPEEGGELYIWGINLNSVKGILGYLSAQIFTLIMSQGYIFDIKWQEEISKLLPKPHVIKPKQGDLVIFHSGRPHSVAPVKGVRVTNQLFIDAKRALPLTIRS